MTELSNSEVDALLLDLQHGGEARKAAVSALFNAFALPIRRFFTLRGVAPADAEDLLQEVFIALITRSHSFTAKGQGRGWLWSVVRSRLADLHRATSPAMTTELDDDWLIDEQGFDQARLGACIEGQMAQFSRDYPEGAQALAWVTTDGMDLKTVAGMLERSYGATREFMRQVRARLRQYIDPCLA